MFQASQKTSTATNIQNIGLASKEILFFCFAFLKFTAGNLRGWYNGSGTLNKVSVYV